MMERDSALNEVAESKLRRLLAYNKSSNCADTQVDRIAEARHGGLAWRRFLTSTTGGWRSGFEVKHSRWRGIVFGKR